MKFKLTLNDSIINMNNNEKHIKNRTELRAYFDSILPVISKKKIKSILPYDTWMHDNYEFRDFPSHISFNDTIVFDSSCAIIFEDDSFLDFCELFVSDAYLGLFDLTDSDIEKINSFSRKDLLNNAGYVYSPGYRTWTEYSFEYSNVESIDIEVVDYPVSVWIGDDIEDDVMPPDAFGTITFKLSNGNELIFSPEDADMDGYMDLVAKGLKVHRTTYSAPEEEYYNIGKKQSN